MDTNLPPSQRFDPYAHGIASGYNDIHTPFLGPAPRPAKTSPYAKKSTAKWNMPESYIGENEYMRDTMEDWMLTADQTWYTERILPWYRTDQVHIQWEEWENNAHYMGITPHQATSNVVTQKRTIRKANMVRRGIAAEFEHDFVSTALGRTSFLASLAQMGRAVQETANIEVLRALLGAHRYQQVYIRKHGIIKDGELDAFLTRRANRFMIAQKDDFGLEKLNTLIDQDMEAYQAQANVWILGREVMDYCSLVPEGKVLYLYGGQEAVDRVNGRPQNGTARAGTMGNVDSLQPKRMIADVPVYLAKSYHVDQVGQADLLSRTTEVGVFNTMIDRNRSYRSGYRTESRNIRVYDNDADDWAEITLQEAIDNCVIWDSNGDVADPFTRGRGRVNDPRGPPDADSDFLQIYNADANVSERIRFVGDLGSEWISASNLEAAGWSLFNRVGAPIGAPKNGGPLTDEGDTGDITSGAFTAWANRVRNVIGGDSLFFLPRDGSSTEGGLYNTLVQGGGIPIRARIDSSIEASASAQVPREAAEAKHAAFLGTTLGEVVPETHKDELEAIVSDTQKTWQQRATAIESLIVDCFRADPSSISALPSEKRIKQWAANRTKTYGEKFDLWAQQQTAASIGASASTTAQIKYISVGEPIPQGWERVPGAPAPKACPTSLKDFPYLKEVFVGGNSSQSRGARGTRRMGAALIGAEETPAQRQTRLASRYNNVDANIRKIAATSAPLIIKWLAILYLGARYNKDRFMTFADNNIYVPAGFLLMRPHATYRTRYGIKCADGGRTGYTFFGHSNMQIEHEAARKVGLMHYTAYLTAVVLRPKNVYVVEDLYCEKYLGGMGVSFWSVAEYTRKQANRRSKSILCAPLPPTLKQKLEKKMDVRGRWYTEHRIGLVDDERMTRIAYPGASRVAAILGWVDPVRKAKASHIQSRTRVAMNFICWQGVQFAFNTTTESWGDVTIEQGNFGSKVYPGCGQVRNGHLKYLERPAYLGVGGGIKN